MQSRPRTGPKDSLVWRLSTSIPLVGSLVWSSNGNHSLPPYPANAPVPPRYFRSPSTGLLCYHCTWTPTTPPKAVLYILHGYAEHIERYSAVAQHWCDKGFLVYGFDHIGHGQSEGDPGYFTRFEHLAQDALHFTKDVCPAPPNLPRFLFGHSMGGLCALYTAHSAPPGHFSGLILSGPFLHGDPAVDTAVNRAAARLLSSTFPKLEVAPLATTHLCSNKDVILQYSRDPLVYHGMIRARVGGEFIEATGKALSFTHQLTLPVLILHGEDDQVCLPSGSKALMATLPGEDKTLQLFPTLQHEILNELQGMDIAAIIAEWVLKRVKGGE